MGDLVSHTLKYKQVASQGVNAEVWLDKEMGGKKTCRNLAKGTYDSAFSGQEKPVRRQNFISDLRYPHLVTNYVDKDHENTK